MNLSKRLVLASGAAALLAVSLTACGGAPTDASVEDFCDVVNDSSALSDVEEGDYEGMVDAMKDLTVEIEEVGTPEDIPDDAREGFELTVDAMGGVSADDVEEAIANQEDIEKVLFDEDELEKVEAYDSYESETCGDVGSSAE